MQAYSKTFARVYNLRWTGFTGHIAPYLLAYYAGTSPGQARRPVLDVCCGTGQLAARFLEQGYRVVGIDLSEHMLDYARLNNQASIDAGQASFIQADASDFRLEERFGLALSTFDALNHLEDEEALWRCFRCVYDALDESAYFIFDLNTRLGLQRWNNLSVDESSPEAVIITRGIYELGDRRAWTKISGFVQVEGGLYERFSETAFNTVFDLGRVKELLGEAGWGEVYCARVQELGTPLAEPEREPRVFFVAKKGGR